MKIAKSNSAISSNYISVFMKYKDIKIIMQKNTQISKIETCKL